MGTDEPDRAPAVTWWGHSTTSIELGDVTVATDPLLTDRLYHLRRHAPAPPSHAARADVVLVSHLHHDHLHVPSLDSFGGAVPVVVPRGAPDVVRSLRGRVLVEVEPGDRVAVAGLDLEVLPAHHSGRRSTFERGGSVPAIGFRFTDGRTSCWYPGDTGLTGMTDIFDALEPVDLAAVPIGGWGPSLGDEHLDPEEAVEALARVGATWALAVHYGTFWPLWLKRLRPGNHHRLFVTPAQRFQRAMVQRRLTTTALTPEFGQRIELTPAGRA
ncbi:MAG: MBL fold metallo-hydrolase [Nocardioides sp.]|uniref:MBL fold metallo-hydrolase n=1 Tax=Nocardioides sp. TaxID=35761 RepID=UPI0023A5C702|nr:MBL fold metallo-hydrolase [Nocardioides sp.]MDE0776976.1 MBL fold metallo-hydrolase [Nocardioides sp.]